MILEEAKTMMTTRTERKTRLPSTSLHKTFDNIDRSRKDAIKIFCIECVGCAPGYRAEIRNCTDYGCPLYLWRPYKGEKKEAKNQIKKKKCCDNPDVLKMKNGKREKMETQKEKGYRKWQE